MYENWNGYSEPPLEGVPQVSIVDESGNIVYTGWYVHGERINYCMYDTISNEGISNNTIHGVMVEEHGDWNLPNRFVLKRVTPPHKIIVKQNLQEENARLRDIIKELLNVLTIEGCFQDEYIKDNKLYEKWIKEGFVEAKKYED